MLDQLGIKDHKRLRPPGAAYHCKLDPLLPTMSRKKSALYHCKKPRSRKRYPPRKHAAPTKGTSSNPAAATPQAAPKATNPELLYDDIHPPAPDQAFSDLLSPSSEVDTMSESEVTVLREYLEPQLRDITKPFDCAPEDLKRLVNKRHVMVTFIPRWCMQTTPGKPPSGNATRGGCGPSVSPVFRTHCFQHC